MQSINLSDVLEQTKKAVQNAGEIIKRDRHRPMNIRHKGRIDLVTNTDLAVEQELKTSLKVILPKADFLAEETSAEVVPGALTWIIDPLDGTTNFAHGFPFVATSVALWQNGHVVLGIVNVPILKELFWAEKGRGAFLNNKPIRVSETDKLDQALVATGFPYKIQEHVDQILKELGQMLRHTQGIRRPGAAAIDLAYTACGRFDGFYEKALKPWDTAAGWLLIHEAGGKVTQYDPQQEYVLGAETILASNGLLHQPMSNLLCDKA